MDLYKWSATAASNNSASPDGLPEGMAPAGVNDSMREIMAAIKRGTVIHWPTVAAMRAITVHPETTDRHVLLTTTAGTPARFYQWKEPKSGQPDDGVLYIAPTAASMSAGMFEMIGHVENFTSLSVNTANPTVAGLHNLIISNSVTTTITSLINGYIGQEVFIKQNDAFTQWDFASGSNLKGNGGALWRGSTNDFFWGIYDGTNWNFFCERISTTTYNYTISSGVIFAHTYNGRGHIGVLAEAAAGTDDLDTINGGVEGDIITCVSDGTHDIVFKDGTGNLQMAGDFTSDNASDTITFVKYGSNWLELGRSDNGA